MLSSTVWMISLKNKNWCSILPVGKLLIRFDYSVYCAPWLSIRMNEWLSFHCRSSPCTFHYIAWLCCTKGSNIFLKLYIIKKNGRNLKCDCDRIEKKIEKKNWKKIENLFLFWIFLNLFLKNLVKNLNFKAQVGLESY